MSKRERRAKGEGSLLKRTGCRFWYAQYYDQNGRQIRVSTKAEIKQEALGVLRRLMGDRDRGLAPITDARKITYGDLRGALLANYTERGNKSLIIRDDGDDTICGLKQLDDFFGHSKTNPGAPVTRLTTDAGRKFVRERQAEGAGPATINRSLACLRRMLHIAHEDGKIQSVPKIRFLKEPPARKGFLELAKFEELSAVLPSYLRPLITLLYYCGTRLGEALQIEWPQVDLQRRLIRLEEEQTKGDEPRIVPMPSVLVMMLEEMKPKTGKVFDGTNLRTEWARACTAVGLGTMQEMKSEKHKWQRYNGLIVHDLRRSAVRNLVNAGVPEKVAMRISGHKTRAVFDRYHIVSAEDVTNAMRRVETASIGAKPIISARISAKRSPRARKLLKGL
jgi:integrase